MKKLFYNLAMDTSSDGKFCRRENGFILSLLKIFLFFLSLVYGVIIRILMFLCHLRQWHPGCRVISVGNITVGGTGKTPLVEYIARYLKEQGHKTAVISRGYKRRFTNSESRGMSPETMGDEPYMLGQRLENVPVIVDTNRMRGINFALDEYGADTVILDDGFQQWKIKKDLEIVTIDVTNPFGNRRMLPAGILRQPLSSLVKADVFVLTKADINPDFVDLKNLLHQINPSAVIIEARHKPVGLYRLDMKDEPLDMDRLRDKKVALFSGIADPASFEKTIVNLGIKPGLTFCFTDHYVYSEQDIENIMRQSNDKGIDMIITTEKDAVKLSRIPCLSGRQAYPVSPACPVGRRIPVLFLRIELEITKDEERLHQRLLKLYNS